MESLNYIIWPTLECLVLVGIHSYLGIHVIRRKVIFVDLALAQLAALGATVGFLFGIMPETPAAFIFSIIFAAAGAAVFALTRMRSERVPHEAVIGLVYAIAAAMAILVVDRAPSGAEHLKNVLVGRIEWVMPHEVAIAAVVYAAIGVVHWIFRKPFYLISERPDEAFRSGMNVRAWDFLFYLTFGVVISISVKVAGVLLVFVFLVVPAIAAVMITDNHLRQLLIGWTMGTVVTVLGMLVSYHVSLPSGPAVVAVYGIVLILLAVVLYVVRSRQRGRSAALAIAGTGAAAAFVGLIVLMGMGLKHTFLGRTDHHHHHDLVDPIHGEHQHGESVRLDDDDVVVPDDPEELVAWAGDRTGDPRAMGALADMLADEDAGLFYKEKALEIIENSAGREFSFDPEAPPGDNAQSLENIRVWVDSL